MSNNMEDFNSKSEEGKRQFEKRGGDMNHIRSELDSMIDGMMSSDNSELEEGVADAQDDEPKPSYRWLFVLFSILGLAVIGYMGYTAGQAGTESTKKHPHQQLFAEYFVPMADAVSQVQRGATDQATVSKSMADGLSAYRAADYDRASDLLLSIGDEDAQFYGAVSVLASGDAELALSYFDVQAQDVKYQEYQDAIQWYRALCHVSIGNTSVARRLLLPIMRSDHYKAEAAKSLLKKM